jgi:hypothetical protein
MTSFISVENIRVSSCLHLSPDGDDTKLNVCLDACLMRIIDVENNVASNLLLMKRVQADRLQYKNALL